MIISIVNHKGGTGKTTTTINLGSALAEQNQRVLLVDFDAQGSLSYSLGITNNGPTIGDALLEGASISKFLIEREGMHLLAADETLADVELSLARAEDRFGHLKELLEQVSSHYDFILIDCPPSLSLLTINALVASDYIVVPMQMDVLALRGLDSIIHIVERLKGLNHRLAVLGILAVMVDTRKNIHQEIISHIKKNYTIPLFEQRIRSCVKTAEAPSFGKSVIQYAPTSNTSRDYVALAKEVMKIVPVNHTQYEQA